VFELQQPLYATLGAMFSFDGSDGAFPAAGVIFDGNGNLWGTTMAGGANLENCLGGCGTVFELTKSSSYLSEGVLYSFGGSEVGDGASPEAALIVEGSTFYGTTTEGGTFTSASCTAGCGTVFELTGSTETPLYSFKDGKDGAFPVAPVIFDGGNLYGTAEQGGDQEGECSSMGCGTVFEISVLGGPLEYAFDFNGVKGKSPAAGLLLSEGSSAAVDGRRLPPANGKGGCTSTCFGTTALGGAKGVGTVFELAN
jgi:hypothetical protein